MWRKLTYLYFLFVAAEGALRKWVLPEYSNELFVLKDLILATAVFMLMVAKDFRTKDILNQTDIAIWWTWIFLFCSLTAISGISTTTITGLRYYLAALPLVIIVPRLLTDWDDIRWIVRISLGISVAICLLGVVQYTNPPDSDINRYAWRLSENDISSFGVADEDRQLGIEFDRPRITGTFSYISTYAVYLQFMFLVAWAAVVTSRSTQERIFAFICLLLVFVNIAMTGSRAPLLLSVILSIPFAISLARQSSSMVVQFGIAAAVVITAVGGSYAFSDPFKLILLRNEGAGDSEERIMGTLLFPINTFEIAGFAGAGIGSTFQGLGELGVTNSLAEEFSEVNVDRIGVEVGIVGYLFVLMVKLFYLIKTSTLVVRARSAEIWTWTLVSLCYQLSFVWSIPLYNAVASTFYFSSLGLYCWLRYQNQSLSALRMVPIARPIGRGAISTKS